MARILEVPDVPQFERFSVQRPGEGAALVIVVTGSPEQVGAIGGAVRSAIQSVEALVDGPKPCQGCGG